MTLANRRQWRKKSRARKRAGEWQKSLLKKKRKSSPTIREVGGHKTAPGCVRKMIDISQANGRALQRSESMAIRPVSNVPIGSHWSSDMADHWPPHCHWRIIGLILRGFSQCPTTCFQRIWLLGFFSLRFYQVQMGIVMSGPCLSVMLHPISNFPIGSYGSNHLADRWPLRCRWLMTYLVFLDFRTRPPSCFRISFSDFPFWTHYLQRFIRLNLFSDVFELAFEFPRFITAASPNYVCFVWLNSVHFSLYVSTEWFDRLYFCSVRYEKKIRWLVYFV